MDTARRAQRILPLLVLAGIGAVSALPLSANAQSCPTGYVYIPASAADSTSEFCVAQFEMKNVDGLPVSVPEEFPWHLVTRDEAIQLCASLGEGYSLISNSQWQAVAHNIESVAANWSSGVVGAGNLNVGNYSFEGGAVTADLNPCATEGFAVRFANCTDSSSPDFARKRTHNLSTGDGIWDIGGNVSEWTSTDVDDATRGDFRGATCELSGDYAKAFGGSGDYSADCSFGAHNLGCVEGSGGTVVFRGGTAGMEGSAWDTCQGIFYVNTNAYWDADTQRGPGFRCVYNVTTPSNNLDTATGPVRAFKSRHTSSNQQAKLNKKKYAKKLASQLKKCLSKGKKSSRGKKTRACLAKHSYTQQR